jgi:hypothetical protein
MKLKGKFMSSVVEKRMFNRFTYAKPVQVFPVIPSKSGNILEVDKEPLRVKANNISEEGLGLSSTNGLKAQSILKLNFKGAANRRVEVFGKIIWVQRGQCGVRFMLADPATRRGIRSIFKKTSKIK